MKRANRRYAGPLDDQLPRLATSAPVTLIGYWEGSTEPGWPRVTDFVDEHWDETERDCVAEYLQQGFVPWVQAGISPCRFCGAANGCAEQTDGVYIWPEGLAHYLREHGVRPPVSVIRHILSRSDKMNPERVEINPEQVDKTWWKTATLDS